MFFRPSTELWVKFQKVMENHHKVSMNEPFVIYVSKGLRIGTMEMV